jgi:hypothetical protein
MRKLLPIVALAFAWPAGAFASSFSVDVSDLWWNPAESGWGLNLIQEADIAFGTLFVYGTDGRAHWYAAPDLQGSHGADLDTGSFSGEIYETTGPYFGGTFNPSLVTVRDAGTLSFALQSPDTASVNYTIDGVAVHKVVTRQTWRTNDINGHYVLTRAFRGYHCAPDTPVTQNLGIATVSQSGNSLAITTTGGNPSCTFMGDYTQSGRMGLSSGNVTCNDGSSGSYRMQEIEVGQHAISARLNVTGGGCQLLGHLGGARADVQLPPD